MASGVFVPSGSDAKIPLVQRAPERADVLLGLRPEDITIGTEGPISASVELVEPTGPEDIVTLDVAGQRSVVRAPAGLATQGSAVRLGLRLDHALLFDAASSERVR
ncbi:TOBE domain-containing protein [Rubellimicrobium mesophilum]|uniref:TOBE domain-containing protein n=1 Tax=Rubellimicrobium mesophilum TaxID=1123067 RepID=UPI0005611F64